jgi:hypothetical protein
MKTQTRVQKHVEMGKASQLHSFTICFWNYLRYHFQNGFNRYGQVRPLVLCAVTFRAVINANNTTTARPKLEQSSVKLQE